MGAQGVGIGVGVAVNRVNTDTTAALSASDKQRLVSSDTLTVLAESNNDIDTIGIGGAGGSKAGVAASTAINLVTNNTAARTNNLNAGTQAQPSFRRKVTIRSEHTAAKSRALKMQL